MQTIYKYPLLLKGAGVTPLVLPRGARILTAGRDPNGSMCIWAEVNDEVKEMEKCSIAVVGTGWDHSKLFPVNKVVYLNTFIDGAFVWHVYIGPELN